MKKIDMDAPKYRKSEYPFKSPHWKGSWASTFNYLSKIAGDHRIMPSGRGPYSKSLWEYRETPENKELTREVVELLEDFMNLEDYTSLETLEKTLPLRYVYILPARHGVVIYSAYSFLISQNKNSLADYREIREYLNVPYDENHRGVHTNYLVYALLKHYFRLYTISKPFRCLLNLPVRSSSGMSYKAGNFTNDYTVKLPEWEAVSSPGLILTTVHDLLIKHGFIVALQFVRYLYRASSLIRKTLTEYYREDGLEKLKSLTERYLNIEKLLDRVGSEGMVQSKFDDWVD